MKKLLNILLLSLAITTTQAEQSEECKEVLTNSTIMFSITKGRFDNPNSYAQDKYYSIHPLTNTLNNESYKYLYVTQGNIVQIAALASAMEMKLIETLPDMIKDAAIKCRITEQQVIDFNVKKINENDPKIKKAGFRFIQMFVPAYLHDYGYIQ